jgi:hypothetical protein
LAWTAWPLALQLLLSASRFEHNPEAAMQLEMRCAHCSYQTVIPHDPREWQAWKQLAAEGPWASLGDGETFEDRICATLQSADGGRCPKCGGPLYASEESLGSVSQELLAQW